MQIYAIEDENDDAKKFQIDSSKDGVFKYSKKVKDNAEKRVTRIRNSIKSVMSNRRGFKKMSVYTTGSDGRFENKSHEGITSNMELVIIDDPKIKDIQSETHNLAPRTIEQLVRIFKANVSFIIDDLERKTIGDDSVIMYENKQDLVFPTRIWDSIPLWGNSDLYKGLRLKVTEEILANPKLCRYFGDRLSYHRRLLSTPYVKFKGQNIKHYDLEKHLLYYDPENNNEGMKYGPLRVIQYSLAVGLMRKIRDTKQHPQFIESFPTNILDRIDYMINNNLTSFSNNEAEQIKYIYAYFLKIYHHLQFESAFNGTSEFAINKDDTKDIGEMLTYLRESFVVEKMFK